MRVTRYSAMSRKTKAQGTLTDVTNHDGVSSTNAISKLRSERQTTKTTDSLNSVEKTEGTTLRIAKVVFPGVENPISSG